MTGDHTYESLLKHLDKFINQYVCCKKCNFPELVYKAEKKDLYGKCNSCGSLWKLDNSTKAGKDLHKLAPTFCPKGADIKINEDELRNPGKGSKNKPQFT